MSQPTGVNDFLAAVVAYVEGKNDAVTDQHIRGFFDQVRNSRGIIASYLASIAFKEMKHLINLLDSLHTAEAKLFSPENLLSASPKDLKRLHEMIGESVERTFSMITLISTKLESRNFESFRLPEQLLSGGTSLTTPDLAVQEIKKRIGKVEEFPRESRDRLRDVLAKVLAQNQQDIPMPPGQ